MLRYAAASWWVFFGLGHKLKDGFWMQLLVFWWKQQRVAAWKYVLIRVLWVNQNTDALLNASFIWRELGLLISEICEPPFSYYTIIWLIADLEMLSCSPRIKSKKRGQLPVRRVLCKSVAKMMQRKHLLRNGKINWLLHEMMRGCVHRGCMVHMTIKRPPHLPDLSQLHQFTSKGFEIIKNTGWCKNYNASFTILTMNNLKLVRMFVF